MRDIYNTLITRALNNYHIDINGCYEYDGSKSNDYAQYNLNGIIYRLGRVILAKRLDKNYEDVDQARHTCHNRSCINPDHIIEGSKSDNEQDKSRANRHWEQQFLECPKGHPYNEENTRIYKGKRYCKTCNLDHTRKGNEKKRQQKVSSNV